MSMDQRLTQLEQVTARDGDQPIRIRVIRMPPEIPEDERPAWIEAHPEGVSKVVNLPRGCLG